MDPGNLPGLYEKIPNIWSWCHPADAATEERGWFAFLLVFWAAAQRYVQHDSQYYDAVVAHWDAPAASVLHNL